MLDIDNAIVEEEAMAIKQAESSDVPAIMEMIKGIAEYENLTHQLEVTEERLEGQLFCENPVARALVATENGIHVGYAIFFYNFSTFIGKPGIYLEDLYVKPDYRGKGHGKALFLEVARIAHEEDCGRMEWMALDWNEPALDFYKQQGANLMDEWRLLRFNRDDLERIANLP